MNGIANGFYYLTISLIWGSTWLAIRISLKSFPPFFSAGLRFLVAAAVIYLLMKIKKIPFQLDRKSMNSYFVLAFFSFIIPFGLVYWGGQYITSGLSAILFAVFPFFVAVFSHFMLPKEKIGFGKFAALILGFTGICLMFYQDLMGGLNTYLLGMLAVVLSSAMQAWIAVYVKKYGEALHPLGMNLVPMGISAAVYMAVSPFVEDMSILRFDAAGIGSAVYLGVFGSVVTFTLYYYLLKRINLILLSLTAFITPVIALILGRVIEAETLTTGQQIGSVLILAGIIAANIHGATAKQE